MPAYNGTFIMESAHFKWPYGQLASSLVFEKYADQHHKSAPALNSGDCLSDYIRNAVKGRRAKLMPHRDGLYVILSRRSPSSYEIGSLDDPQVPIGVYR
ncbi:hypothetical protein CEXT_671091 [Caerostris extrusa]|uniref:Uncharacterized protein n=1 Tax=Caerostris extrusa TaxID=172846 RepID=A0AAV4Y7A6_CAEEX|nr:hypothetical protein CEXT_671091 [Caerostris extrusa]